MNNSIWIGDNNRHQWAEAGYAVIAGVSHEFWYWSFIDDNLNYYEFDSNGLNSSDFNHPADVYIWQQSSTTWNAAIYGNVTSWLPNGFSATINANYMTIGQELGGTSGSSSPNATFTSNEWISASGGYNYQARNSDSQHINNPPYAGWNSVPTSSNQGGNWYART